MKYKVPVHRIESRYHEFEIEANDECEAREKVAEIAYNINFKAFSVNNVSYEIDDAEIMT